MLTMDKSWYRKLFSPSHESADASVPNDEDADVQFSKGLHFANEGAIQDYALAAEWYRKAADQSHPLAQFNLGMMYANGQGVTRDDVQSATWFAKAALGGDGAAQFKMGTSCHRASLTGKPEHACESRLEAYKWFQLAASQGYQGSDAARASLILRMTREDVAEGNKRAAGLRFEETRYVAGAMIVSVIEVKEPGR
jgi:TPR repeat protein